MQDQSILIADIGGTNARFALASQSPPYFSQARTFQCAEFDSIYYAINDYLQSQQIEQLTGICFAVAGPIISDAVVFPNNDWQVEVEQLQTQYNCKPVYLINDFEAIAYSLAKLNSSDLIALGSQAQDFDLDKMDDFTLGVIGPGSGLGIAGLRSSNDHLSAITTEAGHAGFAPENLLQGQILSYLHHKFDDRVSRERLLSGPGLVNIHEALCDLRGQPNPGLLAADIAIAGTEKTDELCQEAMQLFFEILGQMAGDLALSIGAYNGIYIGGGIAQRYPQHLAASKFRSGFENKGRHSELMKDIPSWLIKHNNPGLLGASVYARSLIATNKKPVTE